MASKWIPVALTGDYDDRQQEANRIGAVCYYEQHMNAYGLSAPHYGLVEVASNASETSKRWAADLAARWGQITGLPTRMRQLAEGTRGNFNLLLTAMPACLGEPGPINHVEFDRWMEDGLNRELLARSVADSIKLFFPNGGIVALSVGHLGKASSPYDTGAGDSDPAGSPNDQTEGWYNADIIGRIAYFLKLEEEPLPAPIPLPIPAPVPAPTPAPVPAPAPAHPAFPGRSFKALMNRRGEFRGALHYGRDFKPWQRQMAARGWNIGRDDGVFGEKCYKVCRAFQAEKGLTVDGIVGRYTWAAAWTAPVT